MVNIVTREVGPTAKGAPLTNAELDANFSNLNNGKEENITPGTAAQVWIGTKVWTSVLTLVQNTLLTGFVAGSNVAIAATDSLIDALEKLQGQINDKQATLGYTAENTANKGVANGYAGLDGTGKVPAIQLPSYVDDVLEYAALASFPATGESGKIYIDLATNKTYRWSGSAYVVITASPGSTDAVPEGSGNLYFTEGRVRATLLAGYAVGANTVLAAADTLLAALAKIQGQINARAPLVSPSLTGTPLVPTAAEGTSTGQAASTAFVQAAIGGYLAKAVTGGTVTLTAAEASNPAIGLSGALTSNLILEIPVAALRIYSISNGTTGAFTVSIKVVGLTPVVLVAQGKQNLIYTNGIGAYDAINDFDAIALTGVSTCATAALGTNNTQVASTAYTVAEINSRAPTKTGGGASGSWGISVTGSSASCSGLAASATTLTGLTATVTELNYTDGVTSAIQTQLDGKAPLTGAGTSGTWGISVTGSSGSCTGNASSASTLSGDQSNWAGLRSSAVANMLGWKNYGNGHVIFDASNGTSPSGAAVNNTNSAVAWSASYPTLMGWNGSSTYGLRVDSARVADSATNAATATKLATARTINGVAFDGTANISIAAGETGRLPLTGGAVTGKTSFTKIEQTTYDTAAVEIGAQSGAAYIGFHRHGVFGGLFGVDTGNNFYGNAGLTMTGNITAYSDIRLKTDIEVISDALNKVCTLRGVTYTRIEGNERQTGVIAQEVQAVLPEAVKIGEDVDQTLSVAYGNLVGLLIEAIKELKAEVDVLKQGAK